MKQTPFYFATALLLVLLNCSKDESGENNNKDNETEFKESCTVVSYPGLDISIDGDISSELDPNSQAFTDYINCIRQCTETSPDDPQCMMNCLGLLEVVPAGGAFSLSLYITNTSTSEITYVVEPGSWFEPGSGDYQPMMSPMKITEVITPGESTTLVIPVYCLASAKSAPDADSEYTMCDLISSSGCLADIVAILKTKDMSSLTFAESMKVQEIIWNCTEGEEVDWTYLSNL